VVQNATTGSSSLVVETSFDLTTVDPARMFETGGELVDHALYDTLLTFKGGDVSKPVPDLATSYTVSPDGKVYTFKLRTGVNFSDGTSVTSADVVFSLNRVINVKGDPSFLLDGVTVTAPDPQTVVLTSATPNDALPLILPNAALGIVNSKAARLKALRTLQMPRRQTRPRPHSTRRPKAAVRTR